MRERKKPAGVNPCRFSFAGKNTRALLLTRILNLPLNLGIFSKIHAHAPMIRFGKSWGASLSSLNSPSASGAFRFPAFDDLQTGSLSQPSRTALCRFRITPDWRLRPSNGDKNTLRSFEVQSVVRQRLNVSISYRVNSG